MINCILELNSQKTIHFFHILLVQLEQIIVGSNEVQNYGGGNRSMWKGCISTSGWCSMCSEKVKYSTA